MSFKKLNIIFLFIVHFFGFLFCNYSEKKIPIAERGTLDLRNWNFENDGNVLLDGEWEFYWLKKPEGKDNYLPSQYLEYIIVPSSWNDHIYKKIDSNGEPSKVYPSGLGYATYSLQVTMPENRNLDFAIRIPDEGTVQQLIINNKIYYDNKFGNIEKGEFSRYIEYSEIKTGDNRLRIIMVISNDYHYYGGFYTSLILGVKKNIFDLKSVNLFIDLVISGIVLIMFIYHLGLFILKMEDKSTLYFSIFCILLFIRILITSERSINIIFSNFKFSNSFKLEHITIYLSIFSFLEFFYILFPEDNFKIIKNITNYFCIFFSLIIFISQPIFFAPFLKYTEYLILVAVFVVLFYLIKAYKKNKRDSIIILFGFIIFGGFIINDFLYSRSIIKTGFYSPIGLVFFIISQSFLLSVRYSNAFMDARDARHIANEQKNLILKSKHEIERLGRAKDEFLSNLSHEIKTPLSTIYGYSKFISQNENIPGNIRNYGIDIFENAQYVNSYMDDVLMITDLDSNLDIQMKKVSINEIILESLNSLNSLIIQKEILISKNLSQKLEINGDKILLGKVISKILKNSIIYNNQGGDIQIVLDDSEEFIKLIISDSGIGISEEYHEKIFDKFFRVDSGLSYEVSGVGLGLFLSKRIMELHGEK